MFFRFWVRTVRERVRWFEPGLFREGILGRRVRRVRSWWVVRFDVMNLVGAGVLLVEAFFCFLEDR